MNLIPLVHLSKVILHACTWNFLAAMFITFERNGVYGDIAYGNEGEELTLAIINVTSVEPFTGFASNYRDEVNKYAFGGGKMFTLSGVLVKVLGSDGVSNDACEPIPSSQWPNETWIVLAQYGSCKDDIKLRNIAKTNATAALIYDNKQHPRLLKLQSKHSNMISVLITKSKGEELLNLLENGTRLMAQLQIGPHSTFRYANINRTSVLFVSVSFIILMIISLAWLIFYYIQRFRYIQAKDILARRLYTAAKKALEKIPCKTLRPSDLQTNQSSIPGDVFLECCAVCIETFKAADLVRILPCKHVFHKACVDPWLLDQRSCPMCKLDILKFFGLTIFTSSQESIFSEDYDRDSRRRDRNRIRDRNNSDEVEVVHIPIPTNRDRANNRLDPIVRPTFATDSNGNNNLHHHQTGDLITSGGSALILTDVEMTNGGPNVSCQVMPNRNLMSVNVSVSIEKDSSDMDMALASTHTYEHPSSSLVAKKGADLV